MAEQDWAYGIDINAPSAARMYDYYLGGSHNFAADREAARAVITAIPDLPKIAMANRAFVHRVVRYLIDAGVSQFVDIGSGIPTVGNVHEIARRVRPGTRVVYVDIDPIAVTHSERLLAGNADATVVMADLRQPEQLLERLQQPPADTVLDLSQPVAVLLASVLHFLPGEDAYDAVATVTAAIPRGSFLAISHSSVEGFADLDADDYDAAQGVYGRTSTPVGLRTRAQIHRFFDEFTLIEPGLVWLPQWRPDAPMGIFFDQPQRCGMLAAVARKSTPTELPQ